MVRPWVVKNLALRQKSAPATAKTAGTPEASAELAAAAPRVDSLCNAKKVLRSYGAEKLTSNISSMSCGRGASTVTVLPWRGKLRR